MDSVEHHSVHCMLQSAAEARGHCMEQFLSAVAVSRAW